MQKIKSYLPLWFMLPAGVAVTLFFVIPVLMTFVFSFTTMSSDTGILGNRYVVSDDTIRNFKDKGVDATLVQKLSSRVFVVDEVGVAALRNSDLKPAVVKEIEEKLSGKVFASEKGLFTALKGLNNRPRSFKNRKTVSKSIEQTLKNREFKTAKEFRAGLASIGVEVPDDVFEDLLDIANTSWKWTSKNYSELMASDFTGKILANTLFYVFLTLLFNVGFALLLALTTFYMPSRQSKFFRAVWLIPRISPSVIYILLWRWLSYENGFMSYVLGFFGVEPENWLSEYPWTFVIFANGFVGASMGMIIFASAMVAIPSDVLHAAEVDGAYKWQQVRRIILPLMAWPILFITTYQTLSLMTSFEYILLLTDGGPGFFTTEVWALNAYHTALSNYYGNLRYGFGATLAVVLVAVGIMLSLLYLRLFDFKKLVAEPQIEN
jgi:inositol-phosphate transport system permease protein|tara:strand:+ start:1791 stop:3095 length:1305 start_codon:yes stop_codon:yes gene_type:complete